ncbi:unnamed protein product, partial [Allacma fusca]
MLDKTLEPVVKDKAVRAFILTNLAQNDEAGVHWKPNLPILLKYIKGFREFPPELKQKRFTKPAIFIRGGKSPYVPDEELPEIKQIFPNA